MYRKAIGKRWQDVCIECSSCAERFSFDAPARRNCDVRNWLIQDRSGMNPTPPWGGKGKGQQTRGDYQALRLGCVSDAVNV